MSSGRLRDALLLLTVRLPLCTSSELACLAEVHPLSVRRVMARLIQEGLVVAERHRLPAPACSRYRPSHRGLSHAARLLGIQVGRLARCHGHGERALLRLRNRLERITATRAVFLALTEGCRGAQADGLAARPGAWWVPARLGGVRLDGLGTLVLGARPHTIAVCLDVPCLAPHHLVPRLHATLVALCARGEPALMVFVCEDGRRARLVRSLLGAVREEHGRPALPLVVLHSPGAASGMVTALATRARLPRREDAPVSGSDGPGAQTSLSGMLPLGAEARIAARRARLTAADLSLLDALADHPCQSLANLRRTLGTSSAVTRRLVRRTVEAGLVVALPTRPPRLVLGGEALELLAERDGLAPRAYQRARGVMAIQPERRGLAHVLKYLPHSVGADAFFRLLIQHAERRTALGHQEALVAWEGPAACHRFFGYDGGWRSVRPDGFGLYRAAGMEYPFHLEWDRGTLRRAHHLRKLAAYRAYVEAGAFLPDRERLPSLLYVFSRPGMEACTLQLARDVFQGLFEVPILMTSRWRLKQHGPAGRIWASPFEAGRRAWLPGPAADLM